MNSLIVDHINELKNDSLHGAGWLSRKSIQIMQLAIQQTGAVTVSDFIAETKITAAEIARARPSMISITNYINQFLKHIIISSQHTNELELLKKLALTKCNELLKRSEESSLKAAEHGSKVIGKGDIVMTCSYSSTVCETIKIAYTQLNELQIIAAESIYGRNNYGHITAKQLGQYNIAVTVVKDDEINKRVQDVSLALVGADTMLADGTLINGIPTYVLAKACSEQRIPFYCICETAKFDLLNYRDKHFKPEPGFEKTPPALITGIITEEGVMSPDQVINYKAEAD
ncbi:translation initiation factor eIF-2B [Chloroflexota bacterium]